MVEKSLKTPLRNIKMAPYAIYDYQDEKPIEEKSPFDLLIKDLLHSEFWLVYHICLYEIISLFTPTITSNVVYLISYISVFLINFHQISLLITIYIQHLYIFYPDECVNVVVSVMRQKIVIWKFILTLFSLFLSFLVPSIDVPWAYQMLAKGANYDTQWVKSCNYNFKNNLTKSINSCNIIIAFLCCC